MYRNDKTAETCDDQMETLSSRTLKKKSQPVKKTSLEATRYTF